MKRQAVLKSPHARWDVTTPEAFSWLYAVGCIDMREIEAQRDEEHLISTGYFSHLRDCVTDGLKPSDDVIRRVFHRPFDILGNSCTIEDMVRYWRVTHRNPTEKTPVFKVQVAPYTKKMYPREDRDGVWWESYAFDVRSDTFEYIRLHNIHGYALEAGSWVYAHITGAGNGTMFGIIAEEVPGDDPVHRAFSY